MVDPYIEVIINLALLTVVTLRELSSALFHSAVSPVLPRVSENIAENALNYRSV